MKARKIITSGLTDEHLCHVMECKTSREMWNTLERLNERSGTANKLLLCRSFFNMQMGASKSMLSHIAKVDLLARQLSAAGPPVEESDIIMPLLNSLPEAYKSLVVAFESRNTELNLTEVEKRMPKVQE